MSRAGMNDEQDRRLEALLRARPLEPASPELALRIVRQARATPQRVGVLAADSLAVGWLRQLFAELRLPRPAYVLAGTLLFGVAVGWSTRSDEAPSDTAEAAYAKSVLYADNGYLDGGYGYADEEER